MIKKIDHIGINVKNLEKAKQLFSEGLGLKLLNEEDMKDWNCRIAFYDCGGVLIELVQPTGNGMAQEFIDSNGEGISHICYQVDNIEKCFQRCESFFDVRKDTYKNGAGGSKVFFLDKNSIFNCDTEFVEL